MESATRQLLGGYKKLFLSCSCRSTGTPTAAKLTPYRYPSPLGALQETWAKR